MSFEQVKADMLEMGYRSEQIEAALANAALKTVEGLIDWIDAHPSTSATGQPDNTKSEADLFKYVNAAVVDELVEGGVAAHIAQKATLLSGNTTVDAARAWIAAHSADDDFAEPLSIVERPQISKEEAAAKARLLQEQIRAKMRDEEERGKNEAERLRVKMGKELVEAQRVQEEQKKKRELELYLREKERDERDKAEMRRQLEEDRRRRFGVQSQPVADPLAQLNETYEKMYKAHRMGQLSELQICLSTLQAIAARVLNAPADDRFRRINAENPNFCQKVKDVIGGAQMLTLIGFEEIDGFFVMEKVDLEKLSEFERFLAQKIAVLNSQI